MGGLLFGVQGLKFKVSGLSPNEQEVTETTEQQELTDGIAPLILPGAKLDCGRREGGGNGGTPLPLVCLCSIARVSAGAGCVWSGKTGQLVVSARELQTAVRQ